MQYTVDNLNTITFPLYKGDRVFLYGDLGAGKTTLVRFFIQHIASVRDVTSPTYTYYNQYGDICHFDLYRLDNEDHFFHIGGMDILDNLEKTAFIEWPDKISKQVDPTVVVRLLDEGIENTRNITFERISTPSGEKIFPK